MDTDKIVINQIIKKEINTKSKQQRYLSFFSLMKCKINVDHMKKIPQNSDSRSDGMGELKKPSLLNPLQR